MPGEHGLGGDPRAGMGVAFKQRVDLRGQSLQIVQRGVLHRVVVKAVAHGLGGVGFGAGAHNDHDRHAIQHIQQVRGRPVHRALGCQDDVRAASGELRAGLHQRRRHIHPPARPWVYQRIHHRACVKAIAFDEQD
ncbi:hypothetical protein D3C71_1777220 [compost metagenome]